jgi:hypothetical protein
MKHFNENKIIGWKEAYKEEHELCSIYENFIYEEVYQLKDIIEDNKLMDMFLKIFEGLEKKREKHYLIDRDTERRKKLSYILDHFK